MCLSKHCKPKMCVWWSWVTFSFCRYTSPNFWTAILMSSVPKHQLKHVRFVCIHNICCMSVRKTPHILVKKFLIWHNWNQFVILVDNVLSPIYVWCVSDLKLYNHIKHFFKRAGTWQSEPTVTAAACHSNTPLNMDLNVIWTDELLKKVTPVQL